MEENLLCIFLQRQRVLNYNGLLMEITAMLFWNVLLTMVIAPAFFTFRLMQQEIKRIDILLARTREEYSTKEDTRDTQDRIMTSLRRLEDKLDLMLGSKGVNE